MERLIKLAGERDMPSPEGMQRARPPGSSPGGRCWRNPRQPGGVVGTLTLGFAVAASVALGAWLISRPARGASVMARIALTGAPLDSAGRRVPGRTDFVRLDPGLARGESPLPSVLLFRCAWITPRVCDSTAPIT